MKAQVTASAVTATSGVAAMTAPDTTGTASNNLTDAERHAVDEARRVGPALRASGDNRDRLTGWLLAELVAIIERLED